MNAARVGLVLLLAGTVLAGRAGYLQLKGMLARVLIGQAWEETVAGRQDVRPWSWADTHPVARLGIPSVGFEEVVLEGASPRNMAFGPTRLMGGAAPGEPGNLVLAGHRTSWFRPLKDVHVGDEVTLEWPSPVPGHTRVRRWKVSQLQVIDPGDTRWIAATDEDALTLVTCWPFGASPVSTHRYIVRAVPVDS
jgi:sortase A